MLDEAGNPALSVQDPDGQVIELVTAAPRRSAGETADASPRIPGGGTADPAAASGGGGDPKGQREESRQ
jgi:hypothetical protein